MRWVSGAPQSSYETNYLTGLEIKGKRSQEMETGMEMMDMRC